MMQDSILLTDLTLPQIDSLVQELGAPGYHARQLVRWLYRGLAFSFAEMTDLPQSFREVMAEKVRLHGLEPVRRATSRDGTVKILFALPDKNTIETTCMPYPAARGKLRLTLCISTQVGCAVSCPFCATGQQGFVRNLSPGEIIDQVLYFARDRRDRQPEASVTNLVFMGMGEPLVNYDNLWQAIEMLNAPEGFGLGARNMTISTAGMVPQIERLSREKLQINLAVSLHAAKNDLRNRLVPLNNKYPLEQLIPACRDYIKATGRRVSFEYILFAGINDSLAQARELAHLVAGMNCHVNLIAANRTADAGYRSPAAEVVQAFAEELARLRINCTIRQSRGTDIAAGCGQLRSVKTPGYGAGSRHGEE
jgi:23S rRNA (adenine2503-C2)-methyltransferase